MTPSIEAKIVVIEQETITGENTKERIGVVLREIANENTYSIGEVIVNKWYDNLPIYRQIFIQDTADVQYVNINIDGLDIKNLVNAKCVVGANVTYISTNIDNEVLQFDFNNTLTGKFISVIEYTKTTD